ncbi:MAG: hypothetical protein ORO03_07505, partial [Alphaproteobacteria bacterium]|nr:hypothetical protein [Alphaproteobacteria bacterium]
GNNFFSGDVTLNATGAISQTAGAGNTLSVGGKLIVSGSNAITLTNTGNALGNLGALTSTGAISITHGATALTLNGAISSGGAISLTAVGVIFGDTITVSGGDLSLTAGSGAVTQNTGKNLTLTGGKLIVVSSSGITLNNSGNSIARLGVLTATGATADIIIKSNGTLSLTANLSAGRAITLTATGMNLTSAITSTSGGTVTIDLGNGIYNNLNGLAATTAGLTWTTGGKDMTLNVGTIQSGTGTLVALDSADGTVHGKFRTSYVRKNGFTGKNIFVSNGWTNADKDAIRAAENSADFHTIDELNRGVEAGDFTTTAKQDNFGKYYDGNVVFQSTKKSYAGIDENNAAFAGATVTFWNVRAATVADSSGDANRPLFKGTIRFDGAQNSFTNFNFPTSSDSKMVVGKNSILNGDITVMGGGIDFEAGATARRGSLTAAAGQDLKLNFQS